MRHPLPKSAEWLALGLLGAVLCVVGFGGVLLSGIVPLLLGFVGVPMAAFGLIDGIFATLVGLLLDSQPLLVGGLILCGIAWVGTLVFLGAALLMHTQDR